MKRHGKIFDTVAAVAVASGTARQTAGLPAFLTTNADRGAGGADGTTSGAGLLVFQMLLLPMAHREILLRLF